MGLIEVEMPLEYPWGAIWAGETHVGDITEPSLEGRCEGRREGVGIMPGGTPGHEEEPAKGQKNRIV